MVSVIIPAFNRAHIIGRTIKSVRRATEPHTAVEIIVVDDGSTDSTAQAVANFDNVKYVRQENAGPAAARNTGFARSTGDYVCFLDSDDEWTDNGVQALVTSLDELPTLDLVFGDASMGNELDGFVSVVETYGRGGFRELLDHSDRRGVSSILQRDELFHLMVARNVMFLGTVIWRRHVIQSLGGFDPTLFGGEDWEFCIRATHAFTVGFAVGPAVAIYHKHVESLSSSADRMNHQFILALDAVRRKCQLGDADSTLVRAMLRRGVFGWAYQAFDRGDLKVARERFYLARELGVMGPREFAFLVSTFLPAQALSALRWTSRTVRHIA